MLAHGEVNACFVYLDDRLEALDELLPCLDGLIGLFNLGDDLKDLMAHAHPGLLELEASDAFAEREQEQVHDVSRE